MCKNIPTSKKINLATKKVPQLLILKVEELFWARTFIFDVFEETRKTIATKKPKSRPIANVIMMIVFALKTVHRVKTSSSAHFTVPILGHTLFPAKINTGRRVAIIIIKCAHRTDGFLALGTLQHDLINSAGAVAAPVG
jgi:hypothetical protein